MEPFPKRVLTHEGLEIAHDLACPPELQIQLREDLDGSEPLLIEPGDRSGSRGGLGPACINIAAPSRERPAQEIGRCAGCVRRQPLGVGDLRPEEIGIELTRLDSQHVAAGVCLEAGHELVTAGVLAPYIASGLASRRPARAEGAPERGDMCLEDVLRGARRILPPEGIDQVVSRDDPVGLQEQEAEDGPGMPAGQRDTPAVSADLDGPEDTKRNPGVTRHDEGTMPRIRAAQGAGLGTRRGPDDAQAHPGRRSRQPVRILERGRRCGVRCLRRLSRWRARRAVGAHEQRGSTAACWGLAARSRGAQAAPSGMQGRRALAMRFIQEFGYTVRVGQDEAHQRWLIENEARIRAAAPAGSTYIGTFAVVYSSEKQSGGYRMVFELDNFAALDSSAAATKDPKSEYGRVVREWSQFLDTSLEAPWSNGLLKNVVDATIWDPEA